MNLKSTILLFLLLLAFLRLIGQESPDLLYGELFREVQMQHVFKDSKTFPDCTPKYSPQQILKEFEEKKTSYGFDLVQFVVDHFYLPPEYLQQYQSDTSQTVISHLESLWSLLTRDPDTLTQSSLISLPHPYIVPGGRFREIYYWDSYFTMLGLAYSCEKALMRNMIENFSYLIDRYGFIPNGNRTYYLSRSQPPFYSLMVELLDTTAGKELLQKYLPYMEKEYNFWMDGTDSLIRYQAYRRVVKLGKNTVLNRYWDDRPVPRPESYPEDVSLASLSSRNSTDLYRDVRAACESGWDFSSRWMKDPSKLETIHTTDIIPVDLNCLLMHLEEVLSEVYGKTGNKAKQTYYRNAAKKRKAAILTYCWNRKAVFFMDYDFKLRHTTGVKSLAAAFPLFFHLCSSRQAAAVKNEVMAHFLKEGGLITTLTETHQQWDAPNGWAPLQWITVKGFLNYGYIQPALTVSKKWISLNTRVYKKTGKMLEKYNVVDPDLKGGGGEYPLQDGFGWTNGVFLKLYQIVGEKQGLSTGKNKKR